MLFYPKFHCELNHIEHFWCHAKYNARTNCDYTLAGLRAQVPKSCDSVSQTTILASYESCLRKMELYATGVSFGSDEWKARTTHQKAYVRGENR